MQLLSQSITQWLLNTHSQYQYVVLNGVSADNPVVAFYSVQENVIATPLFAGTRFSPESKIGPWLLQLTEVNLPSSLQKSNDWGFFLLSDIPFNGLSDKLKKHLEAQLGGEKFLVRWWDPRIAYYLLQDLTPDSSFLSCANWYCILYHNNWYQFEGTNSGQTPSNQEQSIWQLKDSDFESYRQSNYYALQLASSISERWLRFDVDKWRQLSLKHGPLEKKLTPYIQLLCEKGITNADKLEDFMLEILKQSLTKSQVLTKQNSNIDIWLKNLERRTQ